MLHTLIYTLMMVVRVLDLAILVYCVMTWIMPGGKFFWWLKNLVDPLAAPFRPIAMKLARRFNLPFDFSLLFAMIALSVVENLLRWLYYLL